MIHLVKKQSLFKLTPISILVLLILSMISLSSSSCSKDDPEPDLVPITMTGANTMGFYVDGVPCNIERKGSWNFPRGVDYFLFSENEIQISGNLGSDQIIKFLRLKFKIDSFNPLRKYILKSDILDSGQGLTLDNQSLGGQEYVTDSTNTGEINILKFNEKLISGTFQFNAINKESGKIIKINEGRFDINR